MNIKRTLSLALLISFSIFALTGCLFAKDGELSLIEDVPHTDYDGIYISIDSIDEPSENRAINVLWHNNTNFNAVFGVGYSIERLDDDGKWVSVQTSDFPVIEIACVAAPGEVAPQSYKTKFFSFKKPGNYRILCEFYVPDDTPSKAYQTYAEFKVTAN